VNSFNPDSSSNPDQFHTLNFTNDYSLLPKPMDEKETKQLMGELCNYWRDFKFEGNLKFLNDWPPEIGGEK